MNTKLYSRIAKIETHEETMCGTEKERILNRLKKEMKPKRHVILKTLCTAAACFVLLVTASMFSPVLAENIPFMENIRSIRFSSPAPSQSASTLVSARNMKSMKLTIPSR